MAGCQIHKLSHAITCVNKLSVMRNPKAPLVLRLRQERRPLRADQARLYPARREIDIGLGAQLDAAIARKEALTNG